MIGARIKELRLEGSPPGEGGGEMVIWLEGDVGGGTVHCSFGAPEAESLGDRFWVGEAEEESGSQDGVQVSSGPGTSWEAKRNAIPYLCWYLLLEYSKKFELPYSEYMWFGLRSTLGLKLVYKFHQEAALKIFAVGLYLDDGCECYRWRILTQEKMKS